MNKKALDRRVKKNILASPQDLYISCTPGLEEACEIELSSLGIDSERSKEAGSLDAKASMEQIWSLAYQSHTAAKLYLRLAKFKAEGFKEMRSKVASLPWELYLKEGACYQFRFSLKHCRLHVTDNIGKTIERSIRDRFEEMEGNSPAHSTQQQATSKRQKLQTILVRGVDDHFTLSLDAGGGPLYERGYRKNVIAAPLRETLAASLLLLMEQNYPELQSQSRRLIDPMCGSGTFSLEALGLAMGLPAGIDREFPFETWPSFRPARFDYNRREVLKAAQEKLKEASFTALATDSMGDALRASKDNFSDFCELYAHDMQSSDLENTIKIGQENFFKCDIPKSEDRVDYIILNPPYGLRLPLKDKVQYFRNVGTQLREKSPNTIWGIIVPDIECEKALGLRWKKKYLFKTGGLGVCFLVGKTPA